MADKDYRLGDMSKYEDMNKDLREKLATAKGEQPPSVFSEVAAKMRKSRGESTKYEVNLEALEAYAEKNPGVKEPEYKINQEALEAYAKKKDLKVIAKKVNEKLGVISYTITKNDERLATIESTVKDLKSEKPSVSPEKKALLTLSMSMSIIASSLKRVNMSLGGLSKIKVTPEVAAPIAAPAVAATMKAEGGQQEGGILGLIKEFFTNPAVVAALAGIVYTVLPKEYQDKIKGFLSGFAAGLEKTLGDEENGLKGFTKSIKIAGYGIATIFGLKFLSSIASATTTAIKIVKLLGLGAGKLGRLGKVGGKLGKIGAMAAVGGAAVGAYALTGKDKEAEEEDKLTEPKKVEATEKPSPAASAPATGSATGGAEGASASPSTGSSPSTGAAPMAAGKPSTSATYGAKVQGVGETGSASEAMAFFQAKGWTKEQAAGLVGNLQAESGPNMKTDAVGDGGKAYGIAQWHPDRQVKFQQVYGKPIQQAGFKEQLEFVNWELNNNEKRAGNILRATKTPEEAAAAVDKYYERSSGAHLKNRIANALALTSGKAAEQEKMTSPAPSAAPEPIVASNGAKIDQATKSVRQASEPSPKTEITTLNNSTQTGVDKSAKKPSHDIPSPIANRGSLEYYTKHSTFYI